MGNPAQWMFSQTSGEISREGVHLEFGYSGHGQGKNNPASEAVHNVGPIPKGRYKFGALALNKKHGPIARYLHACVGTETYGRDGFMLHADSIEHPGEASEGCICASRPTRELPQEGDDLLVTA